MNRTENLLILIFFVFLIHHFPCRDRNLNTVTAEKGVLTSMNEKNSNINQKIPVILDTDIGGDIDDTWALAMMLKCPELDVKMVLSDTGNTTYRSKIIAKMLEIAGRTDIPVGIGIHCSDQTGRQEPWVEDYELSSYPGTVYQDGVDALIDTIMSSPETITLICIGAVPNIAAALEREPRITEKARFVGMHGSIRRGYGGSEEVSAEANVRNHTDACQKVFTARWDMTITPLDTCGLVHLKGEKYRKVRECKEPLIQAMIENYRIWWAEACSNSDRELDKNRAEKESTTLFDTVAIYLAFSEELVVIEKLGIRVTDDGYTVIDDNAKTINCATEWKDLSAFEDLLVRRLTDK